MGHAENTGESRVIDTDEGRFITTLQENDRGMFMDITPAESDDESISRRMPSDCPECGLDCLMPPMFLFEPSTSGTAIGGGGVTVTVENPSRCIRIDGFGREKDSLIHLVVTNGREENYQVGVLESGEVLLERDVLPGKELHEQLVPLGDRRYTFSISAYVDQAQELPTQVGFAVYRFEDDTEPVQSLMMINLGAGQ